MALAALRGGAKEVPLNTESGNDMGTTAAATLDLLESRLRAIEYALYGHLDKTVIDDMKATSAAERLRELEVGLEHYTAKTKVIQDLLKLHAQSPDLFQTSDSEEVPSLLDTETKAAIVLSAAPSYPSTGSSLTSILDTPIPDAELSAKVMSTAPQLSDLVALQNSQLKTIAALKERTSAVLQRWYYVDVIQSGEYWADVEGRVDVVEQTVRQATHARHQEDLS